MQIIKSSWFMFMMIVVKSLETCVLYNFHTISVHFDFRRSYFVDNVPMLVEFTMFEKVTTFDCLPQTSIILKLHWFVFAALFSLISHRNGCCFRVAILISNELIWLLRMIFFQWHSFFFLKVDGTNVFQHDNSITFNMPFIIHNSMMLANGNGTNFVKRMKMRRNFAIIFVFFLGIKNSL